jgi:hypothetical protein
MGSERVAYSRGEKTPPDLNANFTIGRVEIDEHDPYYTSQAGKQLTGRAVLTRRRRWRDVDDCQ